jgi:hypothetical protein
MLNKIFLVAADGFGPNGQPPQQMQDDLRKVLGFALWTSTGTFIVSILLIAGQMAIAHRRGEASEHLQGLKWVAAACLVASSASLIANAVVA